MIEEVPRNEARGLTVYIITMSAVTKIPTVYPYFIYQVENILEDRIISIIVYFSQ